MIRHLKESKRHITFQWRVFGSLPSSGCFYYCIMNVWRCSIFGWLKGRRPLYRPNRFCQRLCRRSKKSMQTLRPQPRLAPQRRVDSRNECL